MFFLWLCTSTNGYANPLPTKSLRPISTTESVETSNNFALIWETDVPITESKVQDMLQTLEDAWDLYINTLGYQAPVGSNEYFISVRLMDFGDISKP